VALYTTVT